MAKSHKWTFKTRFRAKAYGWRGTALASKRLREAVSEIKKVSRLDPVLAGDGAVDLIERLWPALEAIDSSSGSLGNAVYRTLQELIPLLIAAPADIETRTKWLERLYQAVVDDGVDYLAPVEERWGEICVYSELANQWADVLLPAIRETWSNNERGAWAEGAAICLSCLVKAERYEELQELISLRSYKFWHFDQFWAEALAKQGKIDEAIEFAEASRKDRFDYDAPSIGQFCERVLLDVGRREEAYRQYGLQATQAMTNLATFRQLATKYPERDPRQILVDLINMHGAPGKWFAAAKDAGYLDLAAACAHDSSAEPATLIRAARDFTDRDPAFAARVAFCALEHLLAGGGYEPTPLDVALAYRHLMGAADKSGQSEQARAEVERLLEREAAPGAEPLRRALDSEHRRRTVDR
jgi:hypothetical protein